jgi:toxin-antitoxin system PIN domain toxin
MILIDANVLIYAHHAGAAEHQRARHWLERTIESGEQIGFAWVTLLAFLRITTSPKPFPSPFTTQEAASVVTGLLSNSSTFVLHPTDRHWSILGQVMSDGQARGPLVMDAHLAALAIEHGATLCTTDRDFTRFQGLRLLNPLE